MVPFCSACLYPSGSSLHLQAFVATRRGRRFLHAALDLVYGPFILVFPVVPVVPSPGGPFLIVTLMLKAHCGGQGKWVPKLEKSHDQP